MHYYIDGYNLLFRVLHEDNSLQIQRLKIIHNLNAKIQVLNLDVTIVFDSIYQRGESTRSHFNSLEIIYTSHGESADEFILNELQSKPHNLQETVVTSDKGLAWRARRRQAKTETIDEFLTQLNQRYQNKKRQTGSTSIEKKVPEKKEPLSPLKKNSSTPSNHSNIEECFEYYREVFEKQFNESQEKIKTTKQKKLKKLLKHSQKQSEPEDPISNSRRWLAIFEQRYQEDEKNSSS